MSGQQFAPDYIQVHERIAAFYAKHPEGSLQSEIFELSESRVVMRAYAYRTPTDERPGIGYSSLEIPGKTPYTRGSEIENCETSAWGRAIAALGFEVKRGIATAEEVRNKSNAPAPAASSSAAGEREGGRPVARPPSQPVPEEPEGMFEAPARSSEQGMTLRALLSAIDSSGLDQAKVAAVAKRLWGTGSFRSLNDEQRAVVWEEVAPR